MRETLDYPNMVIKQISDTIFGPDGIVDADDKQHFEGLLISLEETWGKLEDGIKRERKFYLWFLKNKAEDMIAHMIKSVRTAAGLEGRYYQNKSESANNQIKMHIDFNKCTWPEFNIKLEELCRRQLEDMKKAMTGRGNYRLSPDFERFFIPFNEFDNMSEAMQQKKLKAFLSAQPASLPVANIEQEDNLVPSV